MKKAIVIFSGGQDSTTCLYFAMKYFDHVEAITFRYGQRHEIEIEQSIKICSMNHIKQTIIDIDFMNKIAESALIDGGDINEKNEKGLPASFVPNRNQIFITLAHALAQKIGANDLITGVCETDFSGYPDCRQIFIDSISVSSNLGSDSNIKIHAPLMDLSKSETFEMADDLECLDDVLVYSHSCYNGIRDKFHEWGYGCAECAACNLRMNGFYEYQEKLSIR